MVSQRDVTLGPAAKRAWLASVIRYLQTVTTWPRRTEGKLEPRIAGVDIVTTENMARHVAASYRDRILVVSDSTAEGTAPVQADGRELLVSDVRDSRTGDSEGLTPLEYVYSAVFTYPPGPGLWVFEGDYVHYPNTLPSAREFPGEYRPATRDDLTIAGLGVWSWLDKSFDLSMASTRAIAHAMHAPECPDRQHFAAIPATEPLEVNRAKCTCEQFAEHALRATVTIGRNQVTDPATVAHLREAIYGIKPAPLDAEREP